MDIGKTLVELLHGSDVVKGIFWHHHMLFPGCKYNKHDNKWVLVFEDKEKGEIVESISQVEPKSDLQHIEGLFYNQRIK